MKSIDASAYQALLAGAKVLERDRHGAKVLALADGNLVKVFRHKRWLSTATLYPYARRFIDNARRLAELGILTVTVVDAAHCPAVARHLVTYRPLPGVTLRQALGAVAADRHRLLVEFARLVATLHQKGVYFRSLHFGNVIVASGGEGLGLIDVADMSFRAGPLTLRQRERNFAHMLRYREDRQALQAYGWERFLDAYLQAAALPTRAAQQLAGRIGGLVEQCAVDSGGR